VVFAEKNGLARLSQIAARPLDDGANKEHWHIIIRDALARLRYHPDTVEACCPLHEDPPKMFPVTNSAAAHALARHVHDRIAFEVARDTVGRAYLTVVHSFLDGKELGQFFTPPPAVEYLAGRAASGRVLGRTFDPTCGSGGFLAAAVRGGATEVHGGEIDVRVRLLAFFGALAARAVGPRVRRADFLREPVAEAPFDTVLANPPFGVKGIKHEELTAEHGPNGPEGLAAFPLKSTATGFFLQRIVRSLAVGGRACVILPLGRELASRAAADVTFRRALLTAVALLEIVVIPAGAFENTGIRTVALVFDKVRELGDCLDRKRRGKGFATELRPGLAPATAVFRLVQLRTAADGKTVLAEAEPLPGALAEVSLAQLEAAGWSLSPDDYKLVAAASAETSAYPMVRLGDICAFKAPGNLRKAEFRPGCVPVIGGGMSSIGCHSVSNTEPGAILISGCGAAGFVSQYPTATFRTTHCYEIVPNAKATNRYLFHALKTQEAHLQTLRFGAVQPYLHKEQFADLEIPLPPLELQRAIAAELDAQVADAELLEKAASAAERAKRIALDNHLYKYGFLRTLNGCNVLAEGVEAVRLGDICKFKGGQHKSGDKTEHGAHPFYTATISNPTGRSDLVPIDFPEFILFAKQGGNSKDLASEVGLAKAWLLREPACATCHMTAMHTFAPRVLSAYLAHWLNNSAQYVRETCARFCTGLGSISLERLSELEIPLPPLELQRAIAAELDGLDATAKGLAANQARAGIKTTLSRILAPGGDGLAAPAALGGALADDCLADLLGLGADESAACADDGAPCDDDGAACADDGDTCADDGEDT